jgi:ubiquinone/menaquinone biosynthesis C-methylase UbiE
MTSHELSRLNELVRSGKETNEEVFEWLEKNNKKDLFLFIHYMDVHGPYVNPKPYDEIFVNDDYYGESKFINKIVPEDKALGGIPDYQALSPKRDDDENLIEFEKDVRYYFAQYDGGIRYCDEQIGNLFNKLRELGIYDDCLILLTSDHGEALGENNVYFYHGLTVTMDQSYVPLIIKPHTEWRPNTNLISAHVSLVDIMPTILELIGFDFPELEIDGVSILDIEKYTNRRIISEIEPQIAHIDKNFIHLKPRDKLDEKKYFPYIKELCQEEKQFNYRKDPDCQNNLITHEWKSDKKMDDGTNQMDSKIEEYNFRCFICGNSKFIAKKGVTIREAVCEVCGASKRNSDVALAVLKIFGFHENCTLREISNYLKHLHIYEAQASGAMHDVLSHLPNYVCSEYFDDSEPGKLHPSGVRCEDLQNLCFPDNSFDLIITQDVLEHTVDPEKAFKELYRVLKPSGHHIFTVPIHEGRDTTKRAKVENGKIIHILPPVYHGDPLREQGSLVFTDFGDDLVEHLNSMDMPTEIILRSDFYDANQISFIVDDESYNGYFEAKNSGDFYNLLRFFLYNNIVFVTKKIKGISMLEWTGERFLPFMDPKISGAEIHYEHLHRYYFASHFVEGKKVLDLACGEGYGSYIFSKSAEHVVGIDIDEGTIKHASSKYIKDNLEFIQGSILEVPIEGKKLFDVIACFEILEHVKEHEELMKEVKRLLKDDGIFIASTPNKKVYSDDVSYENPFHEKELYFNEFKELLKRYFNYVCFFGQRVYAGSHLWSLTQVNEISEEHVIEKRDKGFAVTDYEKKEPVYFIAIASDKEVDISKLALRSYLTDVDNAVFDNFREHIGSLEGEVANLRSSSAEKDAQITQLHEIAQQKDAQINQLLQLKSIRLHRKIEGVLMKMRIRR